MRDELKVYRILVPHLRKYWKRFALAYLAFFAAIVMNLLKPWPLKMIFDYIILNKPMPRQVMFLESASGYDKLTLLAVLCAGIVGIFFLESLFTFIRKYFMTGAGERAVNDVRQQVFEHLQMLEHAADGSADLIVFIFYLRDLYRPVGGLSELIIDFSGSLVCGQRVAEILETEIKVVDSPDAIDAPSFKGEVVFENVTFGYGPDEPVLRNLSFKARPREMVALIGSSGTGKSTIGSLLLRFYDPWKGRIMIDGQDIRRYTLKSLREQITVVLQEPLLLQRIIRENITYGRPDASFGEIVEAAKAAQAHDFIVRLPHGYDTFLKEGGTNLSRGERQRIALARAILKNAPMFILDEPMAGLDAETEAKMNETLDRLMKGKTSFTIAHRSSTIRKANHILMIEEGRVAEQGTHEQLLANSDRYRQIYDLQRSEPC